jgi:ER membrane protein SH3
MLTNTAVCFFLGILFSSFPYDYPLLWTTENTPMAFYDQLETHLRFMHASPPLISRILHIVIFIGFSGFIIKLFKPSEANLLFDGSSLVLYTIGIIVYLTNIVKGLRIVTVGEYDAAFTEEEKAQPGIAVTREDSLRVLAASNTILALVLIGVLVLQAGEWYAESKDRDEAAKFEKEKQEKVAATASQKGGSYATRSSSKKKQ